jgi:hypothetical protein
MGDLFSAKTADAAAENLVPPPGPDRRDEQVSLISFNSRARSILQRSESKGSTFALPLAEARQRGNLSP